MKALQSAPRRSVAKNSPSGSTTIPRKVAKLNKWRDDYNPLRGLVMVRIVQFLEAGERGEYADLQWLYRAMEKRFATMRALIKRWRGAIGKLDWQIRVMSELPEGASESLAEEQRKVLRSAYEKIGNLRQAIAFLLHAEFRGFAHLNVHRKADRLRMFRELGKARKAKQLERKYRGAEDHDVVHLEPIDQWKWVRDGLEGDWFYNQDAQQMGASFFKNSGAEPIDDCHPDFIVVEEEMPINEIALILYLRHNLCDKDWDAFIELFGIERPNVIGPPNVPSDKEDEYLAAAERIANGEGGYLPHGANVVYPGQRTQGGSPFKERMDFLQEQLILAGTSGHLSMLTKNTGLGKGPAEEHADVFDDLAANKAREISEVFQKSFDAEILAEHFPNDPVCVYFELGGEDEEDVGEILDHATKAKSAGFSMDPEELSERTGYTLTPAAEQQEDPNGEPTGDGKRPKITNRLPSRTDVRKLILADLKPLLVRLTNIQRIEDAPLRAEKLKGLLAEFERIARDVKADPYLATYLAGIMGSAMAQEVIQQ